MKQVVIVGGGVIGLFAAVRLAKAGARVTLLEAEAEHHSVFGPGASAAAAGMLAPLTDAGTPHERVALESFDLWRRLRDGAEWADGVRFDGGVAVHGTTGDADAAVARATALGRTVTALSAAQVRKRTGLRAKLEHGIFVDDEGVADPLRVLSGLAMQARAHGVLTDYGADVDDITSTAVHTHDGRVYAADAVIVAPGAWATERLVAAAAALRHVTPARGHLVSIWLEEPLAPNFHAPGFYIASRREDVVLGATMEPGVSERRVDRAQVETLLAAAAALLPGEVHETGQAWTGIRPMSPDGWPMIGPSGDGLFVAAGHSRNGWLLAPITAEIITAYVFGADIPSHWAALSPERFA